MLFAREKYDTSHTDNGYVRNSKQRIQAGLSIHIAWAALAILRVLEIPTRLPFSREPGLQSVLLILLRTLNLLNALAAGGLDS